MELCLNSGQIFMLTLVKTFNLSERQNCTGYILQTHLR